MGSLVIRSCGFSTIRISPPRLGFLSSTELYCPVSASEPRKGDARLPAQHLPGEALFFRQEFLPGGEPLAWEDLRGGFDTVAVRFVDIPPNSFTDQKLMLEQTVPVTGKNRLRGEAAEAEAIAARRPPNRPYRMNLLSICGPAAGAQPRHSPG